MEIPLCYPLPPQHITALPREILQHIFAFIPARDLTLNASLVSKLFSELGGDLVFWKLKCAREFCVGITGNNYPPNDWRQEYVMMNTNWGVLIGNMLRVDAKYEAMAQLSVDDEQCVVFSNIRHRDGTTNLAPITTQSVMPLRPLPLGDFSVGYFELKLLNSGEEQMIGLGLARDNYLDAMPGWKKGSIGYHGDDGRVFIGCGYGRYLTEPWSAEDVYGCGVDFRLKYVFFTKNGIMLGTYPLRRAEGLFPTIGSRTEGESIAVNFGKKPFCFDIIRYQLQMTEKYPPPPGQLAVPYSKLVYSCKPQNPYSQLPYDEEDDVEDEDNEFDDKGMNKASQYFNSVLRVLMNAEDYPNDDGSLESLVSVLRNQMTDTGIVLAPNMNMSDLRNALSNQIQFNKQSALLAYFLRVYEEGAKPAAAIDNLLPRDEFPKAEIIKCIATLLIDDYRDDHPLVLNTINRGRMLFNFQPPAGMTIMQERGQLSLVLSREIQAHERSRRAKRREIFKNLRANEPTFYYYNEEPLPLKDYSILLGNSGDAISEPPNNTNNNNNNNNINNTFINDANNINDEPALVQANIQNIIDELNESNNANNNNTADNTNTTAQNNENEEQGTLSPQQFQDMLKSYVELLDDRTIPDEDARITGAICQWYTTLDIEMKPDMQISIERNRLVKVLSHLRVKVDEHIEDSNATSYWSRTGVRVKRYFRNFFKRDNTVRLSLFVMIGLFVAKSMQKRKS